MVDKGAKHLILLWRSGRAAEGGEAVLEALRADGVNVQVVRADISDEANLNRTLGAVLETCPKLRGVIHAAMTLDDALIVNLAESQLWNSMEAKVQGAWNLHRATADQQLDFFFMYSSATTLFGNPGQAGYVAANLFLESLATYRRSLGLPALAVAWGPVHDIGYLARNEALRDTLTAKLGGRALLASELFGCLESLLDSDRDNVHIVKLDWRKLHGILPVAHAPRFAALHLGMGQQADSANDLRSSLSALGAKEARDLVTEMLSKHVASILRMPVDQLELDQSVLNLGMDSLMGMELRTAIERQFGVHMPAVLISEGASIARLGEKITAELVGKSGAGNGNGSGNGNGIGDKHEPSSAESELIETMRVSHGEPMTTNELSKLLEGEEQRDKPRRLVT